MKRVREVGRRIFGYLRCFAVTTPGFAPAALWQGMCG